MEEKPTPQPVETAVPGQNAPASQESVTPVSSPPAPTPVGSSKGIILLVAVIVALFLGGLAYILLSHTTPAAVPQPVIHPLQNSSSPSKQTQGSGLSPEPSMSQTQMKAANDVSDPQLDKDTQDIQNNMDTLNTNSSTADQSFSNQSADTAPAL